MQERIDFPPPSFQEITRRQYLARDLRRDPVLENWAVFGTPQHLAAGYSKPPGIQGGR